MATNPLTTIRQAIEDAVGAHWDSLDEDNPAVVKVGNRWTKNQRKGARQPADFPAVEIRPVQEQNQTNPKASSSSGQFIRAWELGCATDAAPTEDPNVLDQCEWELIRAAAKMQRDKLGLPDNLVVDVGVASTRQTTQDGDQNRGRTRWTGAVVVIVKFQVPTTQIITTP